LTLESQVMRILSDPINLPAPFLDYLLQYAAMNPIPAGAVSAPILSSTGLTGATKSSRLVGSTTTGSPTQGSFQKGDLVIAQDGHVWVCTGAGSPGTWVDASTTSIQSATSLDFNGNIHLHTAGNTIEQAAALMLKTRVSDPTSAPVLSGVSATGGSLDSSTAYTLGYTWIDGSGHESALSPTTTVSTPNTPNPTSTWAISVTIPPLPAGTTGFHVYATTSGIQKRQSTPTYVTSETVSPATMIAYNFGGAAPPGATNFPTGTAALIEDGSGNALISGDGTVHGTTVTATGAAGGIGYSAGAGGTVTQSTNKTDSVTLSKVTGQITMSNAALAGGATVSFLVTNSTVGANDCVVANIIGPAGTSGSYTCGVPHVSSGGGQFRLFVTNTTGGALSDALVISFAVIKVSTS
jgi:hypothetical protein